MSSVAQSRGPVARLVFVDYLRAGAILYIVGFWHLWEYAPDAPPYQNSFTLSAILVALGLFVFLSGVLLGRTEVRPKIGSVLAFYRRRLLRIYPLYIFALAVFVMMGITSQEVAWKAAVGLVMFTGPAPATLWFVAMLIWFYLLAPLLIISAGRGSSFVALSAALYFLMGLAAWILPDADKRLFIYFPAFAFGIATGAGLWRVEQWILASFAAMVVLLALLVFSGGLGLLTVPLQGGLAVTGSMVIFGLCSRYRGAFVPSRAVAFVSYASFAMYLFHRPLLTLAKDVFMPQGFLLQWCYLTLLWLPLIVLVSWLIQNSYDRLVPLRR